MKKRIHFSTIYAKVTAMVIGVTVALLVGMLFVQSYVVTRAFNREVLEDNASFAGNIASRIDRGITDIMEGLKRESHKYSMAKIVMNPQDSQYFLDDYMTEIAHSYDDGSLQLYTVDGGLIFNSNPQYEGEKKIALRALSSGQSIFTIHSLADHSILLCFAVLVEHNKSPEGVLLYQVPAKRYFSFLVEEVGRTDMFIRLHFKHQVILDYPPLNVAVISVARSCHVYPINVTIDIAETTHYAPILNLQTTTNIIGIISILVITTTLVYSLRKTILLPLLRMRSNVLGLQRGELSSIESNPADATEIKDLVDAFNTAQEMLRERTSMLFQSEKMASVGQLASGVAHEINNPAGYVTGNLETMIGYWGRLKSLLELYEKKGGGDIDELKKTISYDYMMGDIGNLLEESLDGMKSIARIVSDLRDFSHTAEDHEYSACNLSRVIEKALSLSNNVLKYHCVVTKNIAEVSMILGNSSQLTQVLINLFVNAAQAIEKNGVIAVKLYAKEHEVWLEVSDNGSGIPEAHLHKIFDPFFTTKPVGVGTGLGLHISQKIIHAHGGKIQVQSIIGRGTTFYLIFPIPQ